MGHITAWEEDYKRNNTSPSLQSPLANSWSPSCTRQHGVTTQKPTVEHTFSKYVPCDLHSASLALMFLYCRYKPNIAKLIAIRSKHAYHTAQNLCNHRQKGWGVEWIQLAQDRKRWRAVVNTTMNFLGCGITESVSCNKPVPNLTEICNVVSKVKRVCNLG
jgi:hypothetical protein